MENLPQEIFLCILEYLDWGEYIRSATISRRFQYAVERHNFERFRLNKSHLPTFASLFRGGQGHRRALVKSISLRFDLPPYKAEAYSEYENDSEKEANNNEFSDAVHGVFRVLKSFEEDESVRNAGGLNLFLSTPSADGDHHFYPIGGLKGEELREKRYRASLIKLRDPEKLPILSHIVSRFSCGRWVHRRHIDPASTMAIVTKLDGVKDVTLKCCDEDYLGIETRRTNRHAMSQYFSRSTHVMDKLDLNLSHNYTEDEPWNPPNLILPSLSVDPLSVSLRMYIQRAKLTSVQIITYLSPEFFWLADNASESPFWPNLQVLKVYPKMNSPDGRSYFIGDFNGEPRQALSEKENESSFRSLPNPETLPPFLIAMARAVRHAPSLRMVYCRMLAVDERLTPRYSNNELKLRPSFVLRYFAAGVHEEGFDSPYEKARVIWHTDSWRPDEEVQKYWMEALGPDGLMIYEDNNSDDDSDNDSDEEIENESENEEDSNDDSHDSDASSEW